MSPPRIIVRGATTSLCRRTSFRKAFLAPWHELVNEVWLYGLADAAREEAVSVHLSTLMPTHHHTDVTPSKANLPAFAARLHTDVSCALKTLLAHERYDAPQNVWDGRQPHYLRLLDAEAQASQLTYDYLNAPAAGLVARSEHMPGRTLEFGLWKTEGIVVKRPPVYFDASRPKELLLKLEPPPLLMEAFGGDLDELVYKMRLLSRDGLRAIRAAQKKRPPLGAQALRRVHPYDEARTLAEPGGQRVPTFRIGARGFVGKATHIKACTETAWFRQEHESCREQRLAGEDTAFPSGTYGMRIFHGAEVAEPLPDALLTEPGPLLHEVLERLEKSPSSSVDTATVVEAVQTAWGEEADAVVEHEELNYRGVPAEAPGDPDSDDRPEMVTVHRSEPRRNWREHPRRIVVRRDRRRGRPSKKRGADPPADR